MKIIFAAGRGSPAGDRVAYPWQSPGFPSNYDGIPGNYRKRTNHQALVRPDYFPKPFCFACHVPDENPKIGIAIIRMACGYGLRRIRLAPAGGD